MISPASWHFSWFPDNTSPSMSVRPLGCCRKCHPSGPKKCTWRFPNPGTKTWELSGQRQLLGWTKVSCWNSTILEYILDQAAKNWLNRWIPGPKNIFSGWDPVTSGTHEGKRECIQIKERGSASNKDPTHQWDNETPKHKRIYYWN